MGNDLFRLAQIAKLYYVDKVKQNEIARRFHVTPMMISRCLREAEEKGLVTFHVKMPWSVNLELGRQVKQRYHLRECVALDLEKEEDGRESIGSYLADYFVTILRPDMIVGVSWGSTICKFVEELPYIDGKSSSIVQLSGGFVGSDYLLTPAYIVQELSRKLGARAYSMNAPLYVSSEEIKSQLMQDPANSIIYQMAEKSDLNIIGVSQLDASATTIKGGIISPSDFEELKKLNSSGDCAGIFLDGQGNEIEWSRSRLYTGVPLGDIAKAKEVICVAGEEGKADVLSISAKKGYFTTLITSSATAGKMLEKE